MRLLRLPLCVVVLLGLCAVPVFSQQTIPQLLTEIEQRITAIRTLLPPPTCTFALASASASVPAAASTGTVAVTTQPGCAWTASSTASWATVAGGTGSGQASYSAAANAATAPRTATLTIAGQPFTLTQAAAVPTTCTVAISPTSVSAVASAPPPGTVTVTTTPAGCAWTASSAVAWVTVSAAGGTGNGTLTYTVATNIGAARSGFLTIGGRTFTVSQAAGSTTPPPPGVVFRDNFEYAVGRSDTNAATLFVQNGGWSHAKTQQNSPGAHGWLYTATSIPGYTGPFPGGGSRVLVMEARPLDFPPPAGTNFFQTDFYLGLGNGTGPANAIPGDVWFQFWIYPLHSGSQTSAFAGRHKFFYACNTDYPCHSHLWMVMSNSATVNPNNMFPRGDPSQGEFFWSLRNADGQSQIINNTFPDAPSNIGSSNPTEWMRPNRWTLVKMHMKTTATTGNSWEVWLKPLGGSWTKVSEWIGGVTPGFTWNIPAASVGGHRVLRMPTTVDARNYWLFMDDFVIARTEAALPIYP